jgi:hypothetical protein
MSEVLHAGQQMNPETLDFGHGYDKQGVRHEKSADFCAFFQYSFLDLV